ncbi:hypothetical protein AB2L28_03570 [Kineococcus sp. TBRC 1896]|uniref:Uncharacterized protein n=1 Tax=Kineococcus mangrovi TaxID=1660183 RepID=A0ABV4I0S1_9ACTN
MSALRTPDDDRAARRAALLAARHAAWVRRRARGFQPRRLPLVPRPPTGRPTPRAVPDPPEGGG